MSKRRVVVTGLGVVSSIGGEIDEFTSGLFEGRNGIGLITAFDSSELPVHLAGEVKDFDPEKWVSPKEARHLDRFVQFALAASQQALDRSGLDLSREDLRRVGCVWASGIGGLNEIERTHRLALEKGPRRIGPFFIPKLMINAGAGQIAIRFGLKGANFAVASACASGNHALGLAFRSIQYGDADLMFCGGSEATVTLLGIGGFCALKALSERNDDPLTASRPFNLDRDGFVVGEGAGALIFEEYEHAKRRGAKVFAEVKGFGMTDDGYHISAPIPEGTAAADAMLLALADGKCPPEEVDYINAHGTGTPQNDLAEAHAIRAAFGPAADTVRLSAVKSMIGHLLTAAGGVELAITALAVRDGFIPPTINLTEPDPECGLDCTPLHGVAQPILTALKLSIAFGGHFGAAVLRHPSCYGLDVRMAA
jgi:3-oxoacyl-[acyl-carrier-protein] synthase II